MLLGGMETFQRGGLLNRRRAIEARLKNALLGVQTDKVKSAGVLGAAGVFQVQGKSVSLMLRLLPSSGVFGCVRSNPISTPYALIFLRMKS